MSIGSVTTATNPNQLTPAGTSRKGIRNEFLQLQQDLQSGNLSGAQSAYSSIQSSTQNLFRSQSTTGSSQAATDFQAIGQTLQSGSLSSAQNALTTFEQDMQAVMQSGGSGSSGAVHPHHRKHHGGGMDSQQANAFSSLSSALQSGNTSTAESAVNTLLQEIQSTSGSGSSSSSSNTLTTELQNLQSDLLSGNFATAQTDFSTMVQNFQSASWNIGYSSPSAQNGGYQQQPSANGTISATA